MTNITWQFLPLHSASFQHFTPFHKRMLHQSIPTLFTCPGMFKALRNCLHFTHFNKRMLHQKMPTSHLFPLICRTPGSAFLHYSTTLGMRNADRLLASDSRIASASCDRRISDYFAQLFFNQSKSTVYSCHAFNQSKSTVYSFHLNKLSLKKNSEHKLSVA